MAPIRNGNREGTLSAIARTACDLLGRPELEESYVANELEYELESLRVNPVLERVMGELRYIDTIFVSDMYIEGFRVAELLTKKLGKDISDTVFSSADGNGSKRSGGIFSYVEAALSVDARDILHIGDSLSSDYQMPKHHGWHGFHLPLPDAEKQHRCACHDALMAESRDNGLPLSDHLHFNL